MRWEPTLGNSSVLLDTHGLPQWPCLNPESGSDLPCLLVPSLFAFPQRTVTDGMRPAGTVHNLLLVTPVSVACFCFRAWQESCVRGEDGWQPSLCVPIHLTDGQTLQLPLSVSPSSVSRHTGRGGLSFPLTKGDPMTPNCAASTTATLFWFAAWTHLHEPSWFKNAEHLIIRRTFQRVFSNPSHYQTPVLVRLGCYDQVP